MKEEDRFEVKNKKVSHIIFDKEITIKDLVISDPCYDKDVWCRYERHGIDLNVDAIFLDEKRIHDQTDGMEWDDNAMIISLTNDGYDPEMDNKGYIIGVDTARYEFICNGNPIEICTSADGEYGRVIEVYDEDQILEAVNIYLYFPDDDVMSGKEFRELILSGLGIDEYSIKVLHFPEPEEKIQNEEMEMIQRR